MLADKAFCTACALVQMRLPGHAQISTEHHSWATHVMELLLCLPAVLGDDKTDFGMLSDDDHLWKKHKREKQQQQVKRAKRFLETLFDNAEEQVIVVVTHSGFIRSLLLEVDREPYRPKNAEVVPALVERRRL